MIALMKSPNITALSEYGHNPDDATNKALGTKFMKTKSFKIAETWRQEKRLNLNSKTTGIPKTSIMSIIFDHESKWQRRKL